MARKMFWDRPHRCVDGRVMRHDPQPDDPYLETDIGQCEECGGEGCVECAVCGHMKGGAIINGQFACDDCAEDEPMARVIDELMETRL